jgi:hypothetical protein
VAALQADCCLGVYLASDEARWVTGHILVINAGRKK